MLWRALCVALAVGVAAFALQWPIGEFSLWFMSTGDSASDAMIADYFYTRIWAVPAGIMLFAFNGWLTGMQNAVRPMSVARLVNVLHICFSYLFSIVGFLFLKDDFILEVDRLPGNHSRGLWRLSWVGVGMRGLRKWSTYPARPRCFSPWVLGGVLTHTSLPPSSLGQTVGGGRGLSHSGLQTLWFRLNSVLVGAARVPGLGVQRWASLGN